MTLRPRRVPWRMMSNRIFLPFSSSEAVGSSRISTLAWREQALAMLTSFFSMKVRALAFRLEGIDMPSSCIRALAAFRHPA
jgi:hypothetical protein